MSFSFEQHCQEQSLELYALGRLDDTSCETLEEHILICEGCQVRLDEADRYVRAMRTAAVQLRREPEPAGIWVQVRDLFRVPAPAWAAAAVALGAVMIVSTNVNLNRAGRTYDDRPAVVTMQALRNENFVEGPAHHALSLNLDASGLALANARVDLVDANGNSLEGSTAPVASGKVEFRTRKSFNPGVYFVRLYAQGSNEQLREFGLKLK